MTGKKEEDKEFHLKSVLVTIFLSLILYLKKWKLVGRYNILGPIPKESSNDV